MHPYCKHNKSTMTNIYNGRPEQTDGRPETEIEVYNLLDKLGVEYATVCHEALFTMEACKEIETVLGAAIPKNLFLCNRQQTQFYLLMLPGEKPFKSKQLSAQLGCARLSFANEEKMKSILRLTPGAVSPMGLMNDTEQCVKFLMDKDLLENEFICFHPCVNTSTIKISTRDFLGKVAATMNHTPEFVELSAE